MGWTQPVCSADWYKQHPDREPVRLNPEFTGDETCCLCGQNTSSGIYVRIDPSTVPYPSED